MSTVPGTTFANYGLNFARINATSDGDNAVIEGVTGKKIVVLAYGIGANAAGVVAFKDTAETTYASFEFPDSGGTTYPGGPHAPAFELASGTGLVINNAAGVDTTGHLTYILFDG